jgi:hypothetical protein
MVNRKIIQITISILFLVSLVSSSVCSTIEECEKEEELLKILNEKGGEVGLTVADFKEIPLKTPPFNDLPGLLDYIESLESSDDVTLKINGKKGSNGEYSYPISFTLEPTGLQFDEFNSFEKNEDGSLSVEGWFENDYIKGTFETADIKINPDGSFEFLSIVKNPGTDGDGAELTVGGVEISSGRRIEVKNLKVDKDGNQTGDAEYSVEAGWINVGENMFQDIRDGRFKLDEEGNILEAEFSAGKSKEYKLDFGQKKLNMVLQEGSKVEYNLEDKTLKVDRAKWIEHNDFGLNGLEEDNDLGVLETKGEAKNITLKFNEDGNPTSLTFTGGVFSNSHQNAVGDRFYSIYGPMTAIFGNEDVFNDLIESDPNINAVNFDSERVLLKGRVASSKLDAYATSDLHYIGHSANSYAEFDRRKAFVDIKEGDMQFGNTYYDVVVEGGDAKLKKNPNIDGADSYSRFGFKFENKLGFIEEGYIEKDDYRLAYFNPDGTESGLGPFSYDLRALGQGTLTSGNLLLENSLIQLENYKSTQLTNRLTKLEQDGKRDSPEWYGLNLQKIQHDISTKPSSEIDLGGEINAVKSLIQEMEKSDIPKPLIGQHYDYLGSLVSEEAKSLGFNNVVTFQNKHSAPGGMPTDKDYLIGSDGSVRAVRDYSWISEGGVPRGTQGKWEKPPEGLTYDSLMEDKTRIWRGFEDKNAYSVALEKSYQAREYFRQADELGAYKPGELELREIDTMLSFGDNLEAERLSQRLIDQNNRGETEYDDKIVSRAQQKKASALFQQAGNSEVASEENEMLAEASSALKDSIEIDSSNEEAKKQKKMFTASQLTSIESLAAGEGRRLSMDLQSLSNDLGPDSNWQTVVDSMSAVGEPWTAVHKWAYSDEYAQEAKDRFTEAQRLGEGARQMNLLLQNGVDLEDYAKKDFWGQFTDVMQSNGLDDLVPVSKIKGYLSDPSIRNLNSDSAKTEALIRVLAEKEGINLNSYEFKNRFVSTLKSVGDIDYGLKNSETLESLASGEKFIGLPDRLSDEVKISGGTAAALFVADIAGNPLNLVGAGFAARGAGLAAKTGGKLAITAGVRETMQAWQTIGVKQLVKAYATEIAVDGAVNGGLMGLTEASPELAKTVGLGLGIFAAGTFGKTTLDDFSQAISKSKLSNQKFFADIETGGFAVSKQSELDALGKTQAFKTTKNDDGSLTLLVGDETIKVRVDPNAPEKYVEVEEMATIVRGALGENGQKLANAANSAGEGAAKKASSGGCFLVDTKILMADGSYKDIEDILLGEEVVAYDIFNDYRADSFVSTTFKRLENKYYVIEYEIV